MNGNIFQWEVKFPREARSMSIFEQKRLFVITIK